MQKKIQQLKLLLQLYPLQPSSIPLVSFDKAETPFRQKHTNNRYDET